MKHTVFLTNRIDEYLSNFYRPLGWRDTLSFDKKDYLSLCVPLTHRIFLNLKSEITLTICDEPFDGAVEVSFYGDDAIWIRAEAYTITDDTREWLIRLFNGEVPEKFYVRIVNTQP